MALPLPREHGAWVMTALALVAGWNVGSDPAGWNSVLVTVSVLLGLLAQAAWLDPCAPRWIWKVEICLSAASILVVSARQGPSFVYVAAAVGALAGMAQWLRERDRVGARVRMAAYGAHLAGAGALAGCAALVMAARLVPVDELLWTWWILGLGFGGGVVFVQAVMPGRYRSIVPLLVLSTVATATIWSCQILSVPLPKTFLALAPVFARLAMVSWVRRHGLSWKATGLLESAFGLWVVLWLVVRFP